MCGIAGVYCFNRDRLVPERTIAKMTDSLAHRGPDDRGVRLGKGYALGHRRLSIIDISGGHQPLSNEDGTVWVVANGEIYNYLELADQLRARGHRFVTDSDSEVIAHGYEEWGLGFVERLNGMFAIAILDQGAHRLILARDRLGIKPLYWSRFDDTLIFGSEPKAVLAYPGFPRDLNLQAVHSYLDFRYVLGDETFFEGVSQLAPGHLLVADSETICVPRYWEIPSDSDLVDPGQETVIANTRRLLSAAVRRRMMSDVPLGAYLSGGLDSSAIVALMSGETADPLKTYSIGFAASDQNEFPYARLVADMYQTDHREIVLQPHDYLEAMSALIAFKDAPLGVPNEIPLWVMSRTLKEDITVVLSGEGADELFAGYGRIFRSADDFARMRSEDGVPRELVRAYGGRTFERPVDFFLHRYSYFGEEALARHLASDFRLGVPRENGARAVFEQDFERLSGLPVARQFLWIFQRHHLPGLLQRLDTTTMAAAIEGRVPFVDHELVEFAHRTPTDYKMRWNSREAQQAASGLPADAVSEVYDTTKWALRRAVSHLLPAAVVARRKVGFPVPLGEWLGGPLRTRAQEILLDSETRQRGVIDVGCAEAFLAQTAARSWRDGMRVWMLLNLEIFCRQHF